MGISGAGILSCIFRREALLCALWIGIVSLALASVGPGWAGASLSMTLAAAVVPARSDTKTTGSSKDIGGVSKHVSRSAVGVRPLVRNAVAGRALVIGDRGTLTVRLARGEYVMLASLLRFCWTGEASEIDVFTALPIVSKLQYADFC